MKSPPRFWHNILALGIVGVLCLLSIDEHSSEGNLDTFERTGELQFSTTVVKAQPNRVSIHGSPVGSSAIGAILVCAAVLLLVLGASVAWLRSRPLGKTVPVGSLVMLSVGLIEIGIWGVPRRIDATFDLSSQELRVTSRSFFLFEQPPARLHLDDATAVGLGINTHHGTRNKYTRYTLTARGQGSSVDFLVATCRGIHPPECDDTAEGLRTFVEHGLQRGRFLD